MVDDEDRLRWAREQQRETLVRRIEETRSGLAFLERVRRIGKDGKESKVARTRHRLSTHFVVEEFDCHDGTKVSSREYAGLEYLCRQFLEPMRRKFGPCTVHSGFRTRAYNRRIGGANNSYHIYNIHDGNDQAADVSFRRGTPEQWGAYANAIRRKKRGGRGGIGIYRRSRFVHIDIRDYAASWRG